MIYEPIFQNIIASFDKLWKFKVRGNSLEIITPYVTTSQKFISVFLSEKDNEYVISDGGWIDSNIYESMLNFEDDIFNRAFFHYYNSFNIKEVNGFNKVKYYYKKTSKAFAIPSLIFDLSNFIASIISLSEIDFVDKQEKETKERFQRTANSFIQSIVPEEKLELGAYLGKNNEVRISAIVRKPQSKLILIHYITGSTAGYFFNSITRTNFLFELAAKGIYGGQIENKISLIDNVASGYNPEHFNNSLRHLLENTHSEMVNWSEREKLKELI
jgi:hypothetical protein